MSVDRFGLKWLHELKQLITDAVHTGRAGNELVGSRMDAFRTLIDQTSNVNRRPTMASCNLGSKLQSP